MTDSTTAVHAVTTPPSKWVLLYESADNVAQRAPAHFPAHVQRLEEFRSRGELLLVGTFAEPQENGSMSVFRSREGAEEFAVDDPFVLNGVIRKWRLLEWKEALRRLG
jgi:uncharacterized protein YciI